MVSGPSTSTLINKALTGNSDFSMQVLHEDINKKNLALKLNCLKENSPRCESHNDFQSRIISKIYWNFFLMKSMKSIIPLSLLKNIQNQK